MYNFIEVVRIRRVIPRYFDEISLKTTPENLIIQNIGINYKDTNYKDTNYKLLRLKYDLSREIFEKKIMISHFS
jgi:hypothetical protein